MSDLPSGDPTATARLSWTNAIGFAELCELTAEFINGNLPFFPSYGPAPDRETSEISEILVRLNRRGLLTVNSQPAEMRSDYAQRAWVEGFALKATALSLAEKCLYSDLHIQVFPPGIKWGYMTPITVADGHPFTWAGSTDPSELEHFERVCSPSALRELRSAWYVVAIDLTWGRADHLWHVLLEENRPGYSVTPHPDLDIEHEFYY